MYIIRHTCAKSLIGPGGTDCLNKHGEYTSETSFKLHPKTTKHTYLFLPRYYPDFMCDAYQKWKAFNRS